MPHPSLKRPIEPSETAKWTCLAGSDSPIHLCGEGWQILVLLSRRELGSCAPCSWQCWGETEVWISDLLHWQVIKLIFPATRSLGTRWCEGIVLVPPAYESTDTVRIDVTLFAVALVSQVCGISSCPKQANLLLCRFCCTGFLYSSQQHQQKWAH